MIVIAATLAVFGASARQPQRGYRGFLEWSNDLGSVRDDFMGGRMSTYYSGVTTSHGYQINSWMFVGAGVTLEHCKRLDSYIFPVFVEGRTDLNIGGFTPFGDVRVGYNLAQGGGAYFSPGIGYRFNWGRKMGVNLGVGLTLQDCKTEVYDITMRPDDGYWEMTYKGSKHACKAFFSFRLGIDF